MKRLVLACLFAAACGGGSKSAPQTTPDPADNAAAGGIQQAGPEVDCPGVTEKMAGGDAALATALQTRCVSEQWSGDARGCLVQKPETECPLTEAQRAGVAEERAKATAQQQTLQSESQKSATPPAEDAPKTRGAVKKDKGAGKTADPDEGGE